MTITQDSQSLLKSLNPSTLQQLISKLVALFQNEELNEKLFMQITYCISQLGSTLMTLSLYPFFPLFFTRYIYT